MAKQHDAEHPHTVDEILTGAAAGPSGVLLHGPDGKSYFLTAADAAKFEVPPSPELAAFRAKRLGIRPVKHDLSIRCATYLNYLENHEIDEDWRKVSILYVNEC